MIDSTTTETTLPSSAPSGPQPPRESADSSRLTYSPNVDIRDCGEEVLIIADVPGAKPDEIDVTYEEGVLSLHAPVPSRDLPGRLVRQEYGIGDYRRSFRLGEGFDASAISAEARHGVLTIHVPRLAAVRPRKIVVQPA
jgi:HSP20 family protein